MSEKIKVVVAGDANVGKTALLSKFLFNIFVPDYNFTVGIDFHSKHVAMKNGEYVRLQLWDTAGQERFRALLPSYLRDCCTILVVYDVTNRKTFDGIPFWIDYVKRHTTKQPPLLMVGMKIDLSNQRQVALSDAQIMAKKYDLNIFEVSAATGEGVEELFQKTAEVANEALKRKLLTGSTVHIPYESFDSMTDQKSHRKCC